MFIIELNSVFITMQKSENHYQLNEYGGMKSSQLGKHGFSSLYNLT